MRQSSPLATSSAVAANVRAELARRRVSQRSLAESLGCTQPFLARRLNGLVAFDVDTLAAIASFLELDPAALLAAA